MEGQIWFHHGSSQITPKVEMLVKGCYEFMFNSKLCTFRSRVQIHKNLHDVAVLFGSAVMCKYGVGCRTWVILRDRHVQPDFDQYEGFSNFDI